MPIHHPLESNSTLWKMLVYVYIYTYTSITIRRRSPEGFSADAPFDRIRQPRLPDESTEFSVTPVDGLPASGPAFRNEKQQCFEPEEKRLLKTNKLTLSLCFAGCIEKMDEHGLFFSRNPAAHSISRYSEQLEQLSLPS